jgi:DNA-directed RNA polymerase subunit E'/Rpb7
MEQLAIFEEKIALNPNELRAEITSFDTLLMDKLKQQIEGKCSKHGYVIPGSLELLSRSLGYSEKGRFTSDFLYYLKAQGKVYNPPDGTVVEGEVSRKSKAGLYVIIEDAVHIMIVRDLHIGNEEFDSIAIGDRVKIEIKRSRFQVNDPHILSIGQFLGRVGSAATTVQPAAIFMDTAEEGDASQGQEGQSEAAEEEEGEEGDEGEE